MQDYGLVSIIMPNWNCGAFISQTIESVLAQSYQNWEILLQDDCSTDNSTDVISAFMPKGAKYDARFKFESNKENSGAAVTRNNALNRAQGKWVAFLDSDDIWEPAKLERQLQFMVENDYHFSYTGYQEIDNSGKDTGIRISGPKHVSKFGMSAFCWPGCLTVIYDYEKVGLIQIEDIKRNNDYALWLKVIQKADCYYLDECLAKYRWGRVGSINTHGYGTKMKWHYKLWHEAMHKNVFLSLFWTGMNIVGGLYKKVKYVQRG